jgi:hypothetical protein
MYYAIDPRTGDRYQSQDGSSWERAPTPGDKTGRGTPLGVARSALEGATLNWSPEIGTGLAAGAAKLGGAPEPISDIYRGMKESYDVEQGQFEQEYPGAATMAEIGGGLALGLGSGTKVASSKTLTPLREYARLHPYTTGAGVGTGIGAISAAGEAPTIADIPEYAKYGALWGGTLGVAAPWATGKLAKGLGAIKPGFTRMAGNARAIGREKWRQVLQQMGMSADEVADEMRRLGPGTRPVHASGEGGLALVEAAAHLPGKTREVAKKELQGLVKTQYGRLVNDMRRTIGKDGRFFGAWRDLLKHRAAESSPLYEAAKKHSVPADDVRGFISYLDGEISRSQNTRIGRSLRSLRNMMTREVRGGTTRMKTNVGRDLHMVKLDLDDMIKGAGKDAAKNRQVALMDARDRLVAMMDNASDDYAQARLIFSSDSKVEDAMQLGKKVLSTDAEEGAFDLAKMDASEVDGYLLGAAKAIREKLGRFTDTANAGRVAASPLIRERLRNAFPSDEAFESFLEAVAREQRYSEVAQTVLGNSATARRLQGAEELMAEGVDLTVQSNPLTILANRVLAMFSKRQAIPVEVRDAIGQIGMELGPEEFARQMASRGLTPAQIEALMPAIQVGASVAGGAIAGERAGP